MRDPCQEGDDYAKGYSVGEEDKGDVGWGWVGIIVMSLGCCLAVAGGEPFCDWGRMIVGMA